MIIPQHVQIETINGYCTAHCSMCSFKAWKRKPHIMSNETFKRIIKKFLPYQRDILYISLQGWGEPLLDKGLPDKVRIAKELGFKGIGFATNCTELDQHISLELLEAGLDTLLCGIDGIKKETHEAIRPGTNFDKIVHNVINFIRVRNKEDNHTRIIIRFIRQKQNKDEWPAYYEYWTKHIRQEFGDEVVKFDIHNCAGDIEEYEKFDINKDIKLGNFLCDELWKRIVIFSNGRVAFCNADVNEFYDLGNVITDDPIEIFNNGTFSRIRKMMQEGKIMELEHCRICTIPRSRALKMKG